MRESLLIDRAHCINKKLSVMFVLVDSLLF